MFDPVHSGHGYAAEAACRVVDLAFDHWDLHRLIAQLDSRNERSAALCVRLGMRREAHFVRADWFKGEWADLLVYAVLADECRRQGNSKALSPNSCQR